MRARPITPEALVAELADRVAAAPGTPFVRVAVDGAPAAAPDELADALVAPLRLRGRPVVRVAAADFLRPASLRLEHGRTDPDAYYDGWVDYRALDREVLGPLEPGGTGRVLPTLWDSATDRATRAPYLTVPAGGVLVLSGALLLGRWLPFEVSVHLWLSPGALARRTGPERRWTLPAFERYRAEVMPQEAADVVVRMDDPRRPAVVDRA
ncbi:uridine kinase [Sphaerisporangium rufum]|uniref:Uridine kinase n=1 Tax=Sphaerisporangium rufum TaxID=1381558 RepID=A0A919V1G7_9ACTN|nr:uridine kinase [Sphaerisporangium rufum]GII78582.1 uridine kinase [Sphaerisporangium rufum]